MLQAVLSVLSKHGKRSNLEKFEIPTKITLAPETWTPESGRTNNRLFNLISTVRVADPKLLISDPNPTWRVILDPDPDPCL